MSCRMEAKTLKTPKPFIIKRLIERLPERSFGPCPGNRQSLSHLIGHLPATHRHRIGTSGCRRSEPFVANERATVEPCALRNPKAEIRWNRGGRSPNTARGRKPRLNTN